MSDTAGPRLDRESGVNNYRLLTPSLFPLPHLRLPHPTKSSSSRVRQQYSLARAATVLANGAVTTLNGMYFPSSFPVSSVNVTSASSAQQRILSRLYGVCKDFIRYSRDGHRSVVKMSSGGHGAVSSGGFDMSFVSVHSVLINFVSCMSNSPPFTSYPALANALPQSPSTNGTITADPKELPSSSVRLAAESLSYFGSDPTMGAVPIIAERVSLPSGLGRVPFLSLLPTALADYYSNPTATLVLDPHARALPTASSSPRFFGSEKEYIKLLLRMQRLNMIAFTTSPMAVNGVFGVPKDETEIRLIIDATPTNTLFVPCPSVRLPDPSHLARLYVPRGRQLWMAKSDLESFYHQLALPEWLQLYFALPGLNLQRLMDVGLIPHSKEYDPASILYPMCTTLPMGWSHSVFVGQSVHENVAYTLGGLNSCDNIVQINSPIVNRALHGIIVDDIGVLASSEDECTTTMDKLLVAYARSGLQVKHKKLRLASPDPMQFLGMYIDGRRLTIRLPFEKLKRLTCLTIDLLRSDLVNGLQLQKILGLWTWQLMLLRPGLSIIHRLYAFINIVGDRDGVLWHSARLELQSLLTVLPLLQVSLSDDWYPRLIATDASEHGAGVVTTMLSHSLFELIWPLTASRHTLSSHMGAVAELSAARSGDDDDSISSHLASPSVNSDPVQPAVYYKSLQSVSPKEELFRRSQSYLDSLGAPSLQWQTWISSAWNWSEHINALEVQSVVLALKRILSSPIGLHSRVMILTDSAVTAYAMMKGRSSAPSLVRGTKKLAALVLCSGCRLEVTWVPTHLNPADEPSRRLQQRGGGGAVAIDPDPDPDPSHRNELGSH
jgi:hypothetical protein